MSSVAIAEENFDARVPLVIVGAGAAGLCAALAAKEKGIGAVVIERDDVPSGSTALSAGFIPAAGTRFQRSRARPQQGICPAMGFCGHRSRPLDGRNRGRANTVLM